MATRYGNLINGDMVGTTGVLDVINPANEELIGQVPSCGQVELDHAIAAARAAFKTWSKKPIEERRALLLQMASLIKNDADELACLLTAEQGKPHAEARGEIIESSTMTAALAALDLDDEIPEDSDERLVRIRRVPVGVVGAIVPWNFPVVLAMQKIAPAMLAGCTVVLKPSPFAPLTILRLAELMKDLVPAGVVNVITGEDSLGPLITSHPDIDKITFTGSTATGKRIMEDAARDLKRITLELGGNDAAIVLPDVEIEKVAEQLFWSAFFNAGQTCVATKRVYIHEEIYGDLSAAIVELAKGNAIGPLQNESQRDRVLGLLQDARDDGCEFLLGGDYDPDRSGYYVPITIVDNPPEDARIVGEEQFGPVLPLMKFASVEEAIRRANASEHGLAGTVWTDDLDKGVEIAERLETGTVWVNEWFYQSPFIPFSGRKHSGFGVEGGKEGLLEFTHPQVITVQKKKG